MSLRMRVLTVILLCGLLMSTAGSVLARPPAQGDPAPLLIAARTDLESLANGLLGETARPPLWTHSLDSTAPGFAVDTRLDLEVLAGIVIAPDERPVGWFGAVQGTPWAVARDIRHDLELLADIALGYDQRPDLWIGGEPLLRCDRDVQAMVNWLQRTNSVFVLTTPQPGTNYCATVAQQTNLFVDILLPTALPEGDLRVDLNALSQQIFGGEIYPEGWTNGKDQASIRTDLELLRLASVEVGEPLDDALWFGEITIGAEWIVARGNRHDLEVLADARLGFAVRPEGWTAFDALARCSYTTQNLVTLLQTYASFLFTADPASAEYCPVIAAESAGFVESGAAGPGGGGGPEGTASGGEAVPGGETVPGGEAAAPVVVVTEGIPGVAGSPNAYLDPGARQKIGVIPNGVSFTAWARSSVPDSRMMYISGEGFAVWVGWPWTSFTEAEYLSLPLADDVHYQLPQLLCYASFCTNIVNNGDPLDGPINVGTGGFNGSESGGTAGVGQPNANLQYMDYVHVRILFNEDHPENNNADFRIQICIDTQDIGTCEPVLVLYEFGQVVPPLRVENGAPVWQMAYDLHETARLESQHYYVNQLWVNRPTAR